MKAARSFETFVSSHHTTLLIKPDDCKLQTVDCHVTFNGPLVYQLRISSRLLAIQDWGFCGFPHSLVKCWESAIPLCMLICLLFMIISHLIRL